MWVKRNTLERKLADAMGYEYCTLFDTARSALLLDTSFWRLALPSNVCVALRQTLPVAPIVPVSPVNGLADCPVHLYGYRSRGSMDLELDPLMTGFLRHSMSAQSIISFGPKKMLDAGGGGAILSNEKCGLKSKFFPENLRDEIEYKLKYLLRHIQLQREKIDQWDRLLGDSCIRIPQEQIMPWRVMRRIPEKRDAVVKALRSAGHPVGTNYPPLPGVTDPGAVQWGEEVINFFPDWMHVGQSCEIVKRTLDQ